MRDSQIKELCSSLLFLAPACTTTVSSGLESKKWLRRDVAALMQIPQVSKLVRQLHCGVRFKAWSLRCLVANNRVSSSVAIITVEYVSTRELRAGMCLGVWGVNICEVHALGGSSEEATYGNENRFICERSDVV